MTVITKWLSVSTVAALVLVARTETVRTVRVSAAEPQKVTRCVAPEYRQFDFWVGDWNAYDIDNPATMVAHTGVDLILDGCVLREDYQDVNGHKGQSFSIYDVSRKVWHQSWVTNRGELLTIEGTFQKGEMVLSGADQAADGTERHVRGVWKEVKDGVRETAVMSTDGGKTWKPWFDLMFRAAAKDRAEATASDEAKSITALDTEYQAAVKKNDAATMDRLLADDFVLVTGSGKTWVKTDLVEEARSGRIRYEHQEDTDQRVRVWGDTAVVTAKLWEKGTNDGKVFDYTVWFSDTYVRTPIGWRYVFGQSSLPLPKASQ